ncbi:MAG: hypothetical protein QG620_886, partial [Patescibacteria group bacterium]|nr:hypothetical protein [Patescibacteria group bacterium]MDQ1284538.1 hypothetical protein [Patescibacteria group bacterium]
MISKLNWRHFESGMNPLVVISVNGLVN